MTPQTGYFSDTAEAPESEMQDEKEETKTALLPLNFFQGAELKPGDTYTVRISEVMDDQASVEYVASESEGESEEAPMPEEQMAGAPMQDFMA